MQFKTKILYAFLSILLLLLCGIHPAAEAASMPEEDIDTLIEAPEKEARLSDGEEAEPDCEPDPDGSVLTMSGGVNYYYDQKETYYNLNMDAIVDMAHDMGIEGEYWVREDGCKMLGEYIMVAANLDVHPRGSLVATSLGMGIVVDTGGFAASNPTQIDIAVAW